MKTRRSSQRGIIKGFKPNGKISFKATQNEIQEDLDQLTEVNSSKSRKTRKRPKKKNGVSGVLGLATLMVEVEAFPCKHPNRGLLALETLSELSLEIWTTKHLPKAATHLSIANHIQSCKFSVLQ